MPSLSVPILLLLAYVGLSFGVGFFFGRYRLPNILIDSYLAATLATLFPVAWFGGGAYVPLVIFLLAFLVLTFIDGDLFDLHFGGNGGDFLGRFLVMSLVVTATLAVFLVRFIPVSAIPEVVRGSLAFLRTDIVLVLTLTLPSSTPVLGQQEISLARSFPLGVEFLVDFRRPSLVTWVYI
jgi:hypothetical protein